VKIPHYITIGGGKMETVGDSIKTLVAFTPRALSGEVAHDGDVVDRRGYESAVFTLVAGKYSSTPTAIDVTVAVHECATEDGSFAAVTDPTDATNTAYGTARISGEVATAVKDADAEINIDLHSHARYVKLVVTPDFTGGSSPTLFFGATVALGEPSVKPAL